MLKRDRAQTKTSPDKHGHLQTKAFLYYCHVFSHSSISQNDNNQARILARRCFGKTKPTISFIMRCGSFVSVFPITSLLNQCLLRVKDSIFLRSTGAHSESGDSPREHCWW